MLQYLLTSAMVAISVLITATTTNAWIASSSSSTALWQRHQLTSRLTSSLGRVPTSQLPMSPSEDASERSEQNDASTDRTVYTDQETGNESSVFEALVEYPCDFTIKIVGPNEGTFVDDMVAVVGETCQVDSVPHTTKLSGTSGKWVSVTVQAPVESADMLYKVYECVKKDPRVRIVV